MNFYEVFPGIKLSYMLQGEHNIRKENRNVEGVYEIVHCRQGRIEFDHSRGFYYLSEGDVLIRKKSLEMEKILFTKDVYQGFVIEIDVNKTPSCFSCFLDDVNVNPKLVVNRFCQDRDYFIYRSSSSIEHVFSEMYDVPESIRIGYLKVKVLELLLYLSVADITQARDQKRFYSREQVALARDVCRYMISNMDSRITLEDLIKKFHVSGTQLKTTFKGVYGVSIYAYIRAQKMQSAAQMLRNSDDTVLEIASRYGYENGSKFAKAFRDTIGLSPNEYRHVMKS